jgi:hypothetical protein
LEELAGQGEGLAEGVDKAGSDVALTAEQVLASELLLLIGKRDPSRTCSGPWT